MFNTSLISREEANQIINLHNVAKDEKVYGEGLITYLMKLDKEMGGKSEDLVLRLFILSVDWPEEYRIDFIEA